MPDHLRTDDRVRCVGDIGCSDDGLIVASGLASVVRISVIGTVLPHLPQGLVLTLQPPAGYTGSTFSIFIRNPDDERYGRPGLRLDRGFSKATG